MAETPALTRKTRRIARVVREGNHALDEAIAEARGQTDVTAADPAPAQDIPEDEKITDQVIR